MKCIFLFTLSLVAFCNTLFAQVISTETFETETSGATSFTDNSQQFNITSQAQGPFDIQTAYAGTGWNGTAADNRYVDNDGFAVAARPVQFTISSAGAVPFRIVSLYLYLSDNTNHLNVSGSVTIVGKLSGNTEFTASASNGFNTSMSTNNGFSFIDFSTFGGSDNTGKNIDELVISTGGNFVYVSLDAFKWKTVNVQPLNWLSFTGKLTTQKQAIINWEVEENNVLNYHIEKSYDAIKFTEIGVINSKGNGNNNYNFSESTILNNKAYYRIKQQDIDGKISYSKIISLNPQNISSIGIYPNPAKDIVTVISGTDLVNTKCELLDVNGKKVRDIIIKNIEFNINISDLRRGTYILKMANGDMKKILKE